MTFRKALAALAVLGFTVVAFPSVALAVAGQPVENQLWFQDAVTPTMEATMEFHNLLFIIITIITIFVTALLAYVFIRFNKRANPTPSKTTHNTLLEVVWTAVPVLILVAIAVPSMRLLYFQDVVPESDMTIKAIGSQWYWSYEYPDHGDFAFDSIMLTDEEAAERNEPRLLATDTQVVVPVNKTVRLLVTAADVIHSWTIPSFGVKIDAVPGRINETWFKATKEGVYYGQCSELCGVRHAFMPIAVRVVSEEEFAQWVEQAKEEYASNDNAPQQLAAVAVSQ
ncbi:MAG: cytochrome c oxidase subunit II [Kordiimonas sp.]|nr:cytochrome c oxidase subunit II [Kordiimonas sp.]